MIIVKIILLYVVCYFAIGLVVGLIVFLLALFAGRSVKQAFSIAWWMVVHWAWVFGDLTVEGMRRKPNE